MSGKKNVYGEGNYEASRQYNAATKEFVKKADIEQAARNAAPRTPEEARKCWTPNRKVCGTRRTSRFQRVS